MCKCFPVTCTIHLNDELQVLLRYHMSKIGHKQQLPSLITRAFHFHFSYNFYTLQHTIMYLIFPMSWMGLKHDLVPLIEEF
jgi:hypothetical protein